MLEAVGVDVVSLTKKLPEVVAYILVRKRTLDAAFNVVFVAKDPEVEL